MPDPMLNKKAIAAWCGFDWANSAFPTIVTTFVFATYFTQSQSINPVLGTTHWGQAVALAGLIIAVCSPVFGAIADRSGFRKRWLGVFTLLCIGSCALLWFAKPSPDAAWITLVALVCGTVGLEIGMVFYNALLPSLVPKSHLGRVSGWAWGCGYFGGLAALLAVLFGFIQHPPAWLDTDLAEHIRLSGPFIAVWFALFCLPLFFLVPEPSSDRKPLGQAIRLGLHDLGQILKTLPAQKNIFLFLIARLFYTDGLNTLFAFGGIYAAGSFGFSITQIIWFGIAMNVTAGLGAASFAWCDDYFGAKPTILFALLALCTLGTTLLFVHSQTAFWTFALPLGLFVGPVQAASRSMMARLVPKEHVNEMFGLYALSGKITAFLGPWVLTLLTYHFQSQRIGMSAVIGFLLFGGLLLTWVREV